MQKDGFGFGVILKCCRARLSSTVFRNGELMLILWIEYFNEFFKSGENICSLAPVHKLKANVTRIDFMKFFSENIEAGSTACIQTICGSIPATKECLSS